MDVLTISEPLGPQLKKLHRRLEYIMNNGTVHDSKWMYQFTRDIKQALIKWPHDIPSDCVRAWNSLSDLADTALCQHVGQ